MEKKNEKEWGNLWDLLDTIKNTNLHITGIPERKEEKEAERLFKGIIVKNIPNLGRNMDSQVNEVSRSSQSKTIFSKMHYNKTVKNQEQKEF